MATKTILEKERLDLLLSTYSEKKTFAAAGRAAGVSAAVAKRIISEYETHPVEVSGVYNGPEPADFPMRENMISCFQHDAEWWEDYGK